MIRIDIEPVWRFHRDGETQSIQVLLDFLNELRRTGKITRAAERAGVSYRHAWNLIEKWSAFFGTPLVERHQGRGTNLTPFGGQARLGRTTAAGPIGPTAAKPRPGTRDRDQSDAAARSVHHPRACQPRVRGVEAPRIAEPREQILKSTCVTSAIRTPWSRSQAAAVILPACTCRRENCVNAASRPARVG